jgi:hypothetical protein
VTFDLYIRVYIPAASEDSRILLHIIQKPHSEFKWNSAADIVHIANSVCMLLQDRGFQGKERDVTSTVAWTGLSPDVY